MFIVEGGMMNILVVDGPTEERRAIIEALAGIEGVAVQCAISDLETAASVLARYTPDILVTGTELADGEGIQLVERVRRRGMSIVVVGAAASRDVWLRYLAAGADRFVEPDQDLEELQDVVRELVRQLGAARLDRAPAGTGRVAAGIVHDEERARAAPLDFGATVRSAVAYARHLLEPRLEVTVEIASVLPYLLGVAGDLERLVLELVLGASAALQDGGVIHVVVTRAPEAVLLAVTNAGADLRGARRGPDLTLARAIVERHRGTLLVATCEPASSSVLITLPIPADLAIAS